MTERRSKYPTSSFNRTVTERDLNGGKELPQATDIWRNKEGVITHRRGTYGWHPVDKDGHIIVESDAPDPCYNQD